MAESTNVIPVIMCGGSGQRLWPASRESFPKQFLSLAGPHSLFRQTVERLARAGFSKPIVSSNADHRFVVAEQLRECGAEADILIEPCRRDTAPAVTAAAAWALKRNPDAILLIVGSDHAIPDADAFAAAVLRALPCADDGRIVTFGIRPTGPVTSYGYIEAGEALVDGAFQVSRFVEKPNMETAADYLTRGYLWNSGNFLVRADVFLAEMQEHAPGVAGPARRAAEAAIPDLDFIRLDAKAFAEAEAKSIDYAVMEPTRKAAILPTDYAWSDLGGWAAVWDFAGKDELGNATRGDAVLFDSRNSLVHSEGVLTALVGVQDLVVVATRDAVLVCDRRRGEDVRGIVKRLVAEGRREALEHPHVPRPWGSTELIGSGVGYRVNRVVVAPGASLREQRHARRSEHWVVVSGEALVTMDGAERRLRANESTFIPVGAAHILANPSPEPLEIIEVQSGESFGEEDVERS